MPYKFNPFSRTLDLIQQASPEGSSGCFQPGTIIWWPQDTPPEGWLKCDGSLVSKVDYPELFDVIGYTFGQSSPTDEVIEATHTDYTSSTGTVSASREWLPDYPAWKSFDDNPSTKWHPGVTTSTDWIKYTFNEPTWVDKVKVYIVNQANSWKIEGSHDDSNWVLLYEGYLSRDEYVIQDLSNKDAYKHYRFKRTNSSGFPAEISFLREVYDPNLFGLPNINTGVNNVIAIIKT